MKEREITRIMISCQYANITEWNFAIKINVYRCVNVWIQEIQ